MVFKLSCPAGAPQPEKHQKSIENKWLTASKNCAKTYTKVENAAKDGELVSILTHGGILYNVVDKRTI